MTITHLIIRIFLVLTGAALLVLCAGFYLQHEAALALWPWPDGRLSYIFIASILAAIAAPVMWMGLSGELAAMRGGALDFSMTYLALTAALILAGPAASELIPVPLYLGITLGSLAFNLLLFWGTSRLTFSDTRPVPGLVRISFIVFTLLLIAVGTALIMRVPAVFPWPLQPQSSVVFGCIFLGAAMYFLYGSIKPVWGNFRGQLIGFLAYDMILIVPFIQHLATVKAEHQLSLYVYTSVVVYSALLSMHFLLIHPTTRIGSSGRNAEEFI